MNKTFEERLSKSLPSSLHICFLRVAPLYDILPSSTAVWKRYKGIKVTLLPWDVFGGLSLWSDVLMSGFQFFFSGAHANRHTWMCMWVTQHIVVPTVFH